MRVETKIDYSIPGAANHPFPYFPGGGIVTGVSNRSDHAMNQLSATLSPASIAIAYRLLSHKSRKRAESQPYSRSKIPRHRPPTLLRVGIVTMVCPRLRLLTLGVRETTHDIARQSRVPATSTHRRSSVLMRRAPLPRRCVPIASDRQHHQARS